MALEIASSSMRHHVGIRPHGFGHTGRMPKKLDFEAVREIGLALPEVEDGMTYGTPALKVRGTLMACLASHKSAEPNTLVVRFDIAQRDELIAGEPATYYLTDHYVSYPLVLVRLGRIHRDALKGLLTSAWRLASAARRKRPSKSPRATRLTGRSRSGS